MASLDILLEVGGISMTPEQKEAAAARKNAWYVDYIRQIDKSELLPGAREYLLWLRERGVRTALGSASKNAGIILENQNTSCQIQYAPNNCRQNHFTQQK